MKSLALLISLVLASAQCFAASITCTFTAADGTLLEDYSNGAEATWTENSGASSGNIQISDSNRAHTTTANTSFYYVDNFTPATYNYDVQATVTFKSVPTSNTNYFGIGGRATTTSTNTGYLALLVKTSGGWQIQLLRYGSSTITFANISTPVVNDVTTMKLIMRDHTVRVEWGGSTVITANTSGGEFLLSAGYPTLLIDGVTSHLDDSTGLHVDDYTVTDAGSVNTSGTLTLDNDDLWFNGYDGTGHPRQSPYSEWRFTTNAQILEITGTTDLADDYGSYDQLGLWVNGVWTTPNLDFTANGTQTFTFYLYGTHATLGSTKTIKIVSSLQSYPNDEPYVQGGYIDSVVLKDWFATPTYTLVPPSDAYKLVVYGDSITVGAFASSPARNTPAVLVRWLWGDRNVMVEGHGFRALYDDASDATARTAFASRLAGYNAQYLWLAIGTNDYGASADWSAANFGTAYADLLDKIHTAAPGMQIFCQSPIQRISPAGETANGFGNTLDDYRSQISTAVSTRTSYCTYVNGASGGVVTNAGIDSDGIHLNSTGAVQYGEKIHRTVYGTKVGSSGTTTVGSSGTTTVK